MSKLNKNLKKSKKSPREGEMTHSGWKQTTWSTQRLKVGKTSKTQSLANPFYQEYYDIILRKILKNENLNLNQTKIPSTTKSNKASRVHTLINHYHEMDYDNLIN